ncbi:E3 ubiquitin-protein ligase RNF113A-like isoform X2 [Patiria miniata]|uniref:RING finger protein 113A n=1 Tax=Patiria miniata TaxID=46514 RepID=A0A914A3V3_PATMI|nr:E3 ubiquitin-protein ligase RNF113A-like isoform X2 [Patiria miniata]
MADISTPAEEKEKPAFGFKKRGRLAQSRKRKTSDSDEGSGEDNASAVIKKDRRRELSNPLKQKTKRLQERQQVDYSSDSDDATTKADKDFRVSYQSTRTAKPEGPDDRGATATVEIDTDNTVDAQTIFEKKQQINEELKGKEDDKIYRGINNYHTYIEKRDNAMGNASSGHVRKGPMRAPANLRATTRWDYAPDICKDYKETGFCGFGDSCKFMHDRSDYKFGWQLEREWDEGKFSKEEDFSKYEIDSDEDDGLPFKCFICRQSFDKPVVTKCKHYYCEKCALKHYKKSKRCFVCGTQTNGIFNVARVLIAKLEKTKQQGHDGGPSQETEEDSDEEG